MLECACILAAHTFSTSHILPQQIRFVQSELCAGALLIQHTSVRVNDSATAVGVIRLDSQVSIWVSIHEALTPDYRYEQTIGKLSVSLRQSLLHRSRKETFSLVVEPYIVLID